jgi:ubiquinone/menaquinone biosynthesis C-methylase UbiE
MNDYDKTKNNYNKGFEWHFEKTFSYDWSKQLDKFVKILKGNKVLDAGCGTPRDINLFLKNNIEVEGIDFSEEAIKKCRSSYPDLTFYIGDFNKVNVPNEYYDGIWASASVLNISKKDLPALFQEFLRILKPGGIIYISVKEGQDEKMVSDKYGERLFSFYSEDELKKFFDNAGIKTIYSEVATDESLTGVASDKPNWVCIYGEKISH